MELQGLEKRLLESPTWRVVTQRAVLPWVMRFADLPLGGDVLEVGSGAGYNAEVFLDRYASWRYTATDYDPEMVARCGGVLARFGERARVEQADATALRYETASFDLVISIGVWHHVGLWEKALAECARVLRPGARLLLVDLLPGFFKGPLAKVFPPVRTYSINEVRAQLHAAGFARFRMRAAGSLWYRLLAETQRPDDAA